MNLGPNTVSGTYRYILNQSGASITLGDNSAVNWGAAGIVMTTGTQTIGGSKTFSSTLNASANFNLGGISSNNTIGASANYNQVGGNANSNDFGLGAGANTFGYDCRNNTFGSLAEDREGAYYNYFGVDNDEVGEALVYNQFGQNSYVNTFGDNGSYNTFGENAYQNKVGENAISNWFGTDTAFNHFGRYDVNTQPTNYFGDTAAENNFGTSANINIFGSGSSSNTFGSEAATNSCVGIFIIQDTGRIRLANFNGLSSQTGLRGEARVSGQYLYVCTGSNSGWGRILLGTF